MKKETQAFIKAVVKYKKIAIYIPGSPDPDGLASAFAIKMILEHHGVSGEIFAEKSLSLAQNRAFLRRLDIPVVFGKAVNPKDFDAYIVPDFQSNRVEGLSGVIPCAAHLDHHGITDDRVKAGYSLIRNDVGSTSTLLALLIKKSELGPSEDFKKVATALVFGLQTDTDKYNFVTALDLEALEYLAHFADRAILEELNSMPPSASTLAYFKKALQNEAVYKDWAFYGIGYINSSNRDSIAITADMLLKKTGFLLVAVFAIVENKHSKETYLDVSLRSRSKTIDMNRLIKSITPGGGGRRFKGAYQVKLDYIKHAPDKKLLWELLEAATIQTLRASRDAYYKSSLVSTFESIKGKVLAFFESKSSKGTS